MIWKEYKTIETIQLPKGFYYDGAFGGIKEGSAKLDVGWIVSEEKSNCAAVFTTNKMAAAPIILSKEVVQSNRKISAVIVNSGNANACTGEQGFKDTLATQKLVAKKLDVSENEVVVASTGVIGQLLPMSKLSDGIQKLEKTNQFQKFSESILTTDLIEKACSVSFDFEGETITITGVSKGSGMIHPNMATMLAFITTDAIIDNESLQQLLRRSVDQSFHCISVDGDTSTNDMVLAMANGFAQKEAITLTPDGFELFSKAFKHVCIHLAKEIARDGEGATKLVEVIVKDAKSHDEAKLAAKQIITSSLVKTALFGNDGNWGRIASAIGQSQVDFNMEKLCIAMCGIKVLENGSPVVVDEEKLTELLSDKEVTIVASLGVGEYKATTYGCDLTYGYVKINGDYRS